MKALIVIVLVLSSLVILSRVLLPAGATPASGMSAEMAAPSDQTEVNNYGQRYSRAILRGVKLSDVFTFNDTDTTLFGPAYANVWTTPSNFLKCMPPTGSEFSYALCYYSGPDEPTGNNPDNPSLPCKLSPDGTVANCSCYKITTDVISAKLPYFVDINAISNLEVYKETIETCGKEGERCADSDRDPLVCEAINANLLVPGADLISVFSPAFTGNYSTQGENNSTSCVDGDAGIYAGCMTAPCYDTGEQDANGNDIVECKCPVFDGPYQIGQANQSCNANDPPPSATTSNSQDRGNSKSRIDNNVWSAAFNPDGGAIEPPAGACIPDLPGAKGCGLFDPNKDYASIVDPDGALCQNVCAAYEGSVVGSSSTQVGYTCDAASCTTLGIGQEGNPDFPPPLGNQIALLGQSCSGIQEIDGLNQILLVETLAECSCCASQVCGCENINSPTNEAILGLNQEQRAVGIEPQCDINGTLCGEAP
jgi:hypothetical protein